MKAIRYILAALLLGCLTSASAQEDKWEKWGPTNDSWNNAGFIARVGYNVGGTMPIPIPAEMRSVKEFSPKGGGMVGLDFYKMFSKRWGVATGWHFFHEGFHTAAEVKGYKMSIVMDGDELSGYFTGTDVTNTEMWGMTIPVLATFRLSPRWNLSFGPYFSTYFKKTFEGEVYENSKGIGYLRVGDPTGQRVDLAKGSNSYDFKDDMRTWGGGVELQFDWKAMKHMNVFAQVDWGLANAFESDFETIAFKMFPIYATLGVAYRY